MGGIPCANQDQAEYLANILTDRFRGFGKVPCRFHEPLAQWTNDEGNPKWNASCVAPMQRSDEFEKAVTIVQSALEVAIMSCTKKAGPPHVSLVYGDNIDPNLFRLSHLSIEYLECDQGALYCTSPSTVDGVKNSWYPICNFSLR
jgi:hypothetical protein